MERVFCTFFDSRFLPRGLALHASLLRHCPNLRLWILCLDEDCYQALSGMTLEGVRLLGVADLERFDPELLKVKAGRTPLEHALTCTPILPLFVLASDPTVEMVTYLDADLYFFSDPEPLFVEMGAASIAITPHRYPPAFKHWESRTGIYNDAWVSFRRGPEAAACLRRWRGQCLEWCFNRSENGRFAEQQYLDDWTKRFSGVCELRHPGANLGPWNLGGVQVSLEDARVLVDGQPLVFFHFSGIKSVGPWLYDLNLADFRVRLNPAARDHIFAPYLRELAGIESSALRTAGRKDEFLPYQPWTLRMRRAVTGVANGYWVFFANGRVL